MSIHVLPMLSAIPFWLSGVARFEPPPAEPANAASAVVSGETSDQDGSAKSSYWRWWPLESVVSLSPNFRALMPARQIFELAPGYTYNRGRWYPTLGGGFRITWLLGNSPGRPSRVVFGALADFAVYGAKVDGDVAWAGAFQPALVVFPFRSTLHTNGAPYLGAGFFLLGPLTRRADANVYGSLLGGASILGGYRVSVSRRVAFHGELKCHFGARGRTAPMRSLPFCEGIFGVELVLGRKLKARPRATPRLGSRDADHDGVRDDADVCLHTYGDFRGCPNWVGWRPVPEATDPEREDPADHEPPGNEYPLPVEQDEPGEAPAPPVSVFPFQLDSAFIPYGKTRQVLDLVNLYFVDYDYCFLVEGYADRSGEANRNSRLSLERAENVAFPIKQQVESWRVKTVGKGRTTLFGKGRRKYPDNRRVIVSAVECSEHAMSPPP
jgi:outer membrane protein OmpA-like peptidoglycan-associated protein